MIHTATFPQRRASAIQCGLGFALALAGALAFGPTAIAATPSPGAEAMGTGAAALEQIRTDHVRIGDAAVRTTLIVSGVSLAAILAILVYAGCQRRARVLAQAADRAFDAALRATADMAQDPVFLTDESGDIRYANAAAEVLFGMTQAQILGRQLRDLFSDGTGLTPEFEALLVPSRQSPAAEPRPWKALHRNGHSIAVRLGLALLDPGRSRRAIAILRQDCTTIAYGDAPLIANLLMENATESIVITDAAGTTLLVNQAYCELTGYSADEVIGKNQRMLSAGRHDRAFFEAMWESLLMEGRWKGKIWNRRKDGSLFLENLTIAALSNADGTPGHYVGIFSDVTYQGLDPSQIGELAFYDPLTGLATEALLIDYLGDAARHTKRTGGHAVLFSLNLDDFRAINQRLGHAGGDILLMNFAERLCGLVRQDDTVARPGGDEFAVVMREMASIEEVPRIADKLLAGLSAPFDYAGQPVKLSASIGISLCPIHSDEPERILRLAREALAQAKTSGKQRWVMHEPSSASLAAAGDAGPDH
jgi:diguanylate cyclase (GGDEF)-like protein/PAS domain S-box-containing protein